jgi:hypothetical protein
MKKPRFQTGSRVVVVGHVKEGPRTVVSLLRDTDGGRVLDKPVDGFRCWNVEDLKRAMRRR